MRYSSITTGAVLLLALTGCSDDRKVEQLSSGAELYDALCSGCHRDAAGGNFLKGVPAIRYTQLNAHQIAELIVGHIHVEGQRMPSFEFLSKEKAEAIAAYVVVNMRGD